MHKKILEDILAKASSRGYTKEFKKHSVIIADLQQKYGQDLSLTELFFVGLRDLPTDAIRCEHGNKRSFAGLIKGYRQYCGSGTSCACRCAAQKTKISLWHNSLSELDRANIAQKMRTTSLEKYGVEFPMQSDLVKNKIANQFGGIGFQREDIQEKSRIATKQKRGVSYALQDPAVQQKVKETTVSRYGKMMTQARSKLLELYPNGNPFNLSEIQAQATRTRIEKYGTAHVKQMHLSDATLAILDNEEKFKEFAAGKTLSIIALELGINATTAANYANRYQCRDLLGSAHRSIWEYRIAEFLDQHNIRYVQNSKQIIAPLEIDFFLPDHGVGLEVGSLFWHSELRGGRDKNYHFHKWQTTRHQGISLYQYWDDELSTNFGMIEKKILHLTGKLPIIGARKTTVTPLTNSKFRRKFLENNHIQGNVNDHTRSYMASYQDQLIALLDFKQRKNGLEIVRFATENSVAWSGLFSKMLKSALKDLNYSGLIYSFSDNRHSNGNLYQRAGFSIEKTLGPGYWYTKDYHQRYNRQNFMKNKIANQFGIDIQNLTEWQAMQQLGYDRIWDAGKIKWIIDVK